MGLNKEQMDAVTYGGHKHVIVTAGAGSGKTRVLEARARHLIRNGVDPLSILILSFTRKSSSEISERVSKSSGRSKKKVLCCTFHRFCVNVIEAAPKLFGKKKRIISQGDQERLFDMVCTKLLEDMDYKVKDLIAEFSYLRNTRQRLGAGLKYRGIDAPKYLEVIRQYMNEKKKNRYFDYDDILVVICQALSNIGFRNALAKRYRYILVDEFQDTNTLQWDILTQLIDVDDPPQLYCVGDAAQSIYGFRGSDYRLILDFVDKIPNSTSKVLSTNYRSGQEILDLSDSILAVSPIDYGKKSISARSYLGVLPRLLTFSDEEEEAHWISHDIAGRRIPYSDIMVLCRTGFSAKKIEHNLIQCGIPYVVVGGTSLLDSAHVKDMICCLRAVDSTKDTLGWYRFLNMFPGIGPKKADTLIRDIVSCETQDSVYDVLMADGRNKVAAGVRKIMNAGSVTAKIESARSVLLPFFNRMYANWDKRAKDIETLRRNGSRYRTLSDLIEAYTLDPLTKDDVEKKENRVLIITVHSAKGAERKLCYVSKVQPGYFPHKNSISDITQIEEERRLLYVAFTRAKDELIMTRTMSNPCHGPDFLSEVDKSLFSVL